MAYTGIPQTVNRDAVRLLVGDVSTSTSSEYLDDASYEYFISVTSNNFIAAQLAANSLAALFTGAAASASGSGYVEKKVGDLTLKKADAVQMAASYRQLAQKLSRMSVASITPYAGGISADDKRSVEDDSDRVEPQFRLNQFDNPAAINPSQASTRST